MESSRVALIHYIAPDGSRCVGSGLLITSQQVLTADHVANGSQHQVRCAGRNFTVVTVLRSGTQEIDLAVLGLSEPASGLGQISCARVDRSRVDRVTGCMAVGFPRWKNDRKRRRTAQVYGWVPTAENLEAGDERAVRTEFLTLVGDRILGIPAGACVPSGQLTAPGSPWGGMSGAAVVVGEAVIGVVRSHNLAVGGQSLTVTPLTALELLPAELRRRFWDALGVADPDKLPVLPDDGRANVPAVVLSRDVQDAYRPKLSAALASLDLPVSWTINELSELRRKVIADGQGISRAADTLTALCDAVAAKPVFLAVGGSGLELGQLQVIYRRELGAWPDGNSADALLVEAASAGIVEGRRPGAAQTLGALARFVVDVAATLRSPPRESDPMARWIGSLGHQLADAQTHYCQRQDDSAWLVIDLGDEPQHGAASWPTELTWTLLAKDGEITGDQMPCEATENGLRQALTDVLRLAPPAHPLLVDLAVPRALMDLGIEHWPVLDVDGAAEPLSAE